MNAALRSRLARPSSFLAFHDRPSRCRAARTVSRQHRRPKRSRTNATRRLSVQRGAGSAPAMGGQAACCRAVRISWPRMVATRAQRGAATGALISQRLGAVLVVTVHPLQHGLRTAASPFGHRRGATASRNVVQRQKAFVRAGTGGTERQAPQIRQRLAPTFMVNTQHRSEQSLYNGNLSTGEHQLLSQAAQTRDPKLDGFKRNPRRGTGAALFGQEGRVRYRQAGNQRVAHTR